MKNKLWMFFSWCCCLSLNVQAQTNIISTNPLAEQVMLGNYDPGLFTATNVLLHPDTISRGINARISPDSMRAYLEVLRSFQNRNTGSDTISSTKGIGAVRRWVYSKLEAFSTANENRLITSYLQFDQVICSMAQHRNIFAVLPGMDTSDKSIVLIEAHVDSRCTDLCDTACLAEGMEDNGSGTALVMELARVMSRYSYNHTIVFVLTIGEEQSLAGAEAFAAYVQQNGIDVKTVFNNDVIGGVICGQTSSPPSCPGAGSIDSTSVRIFSSGTFNSFHKQLARYVKLQYKEQLLPFVTVPMSINILTPEDRAGRGGDHIPFRQKGYTSIRLTSANEHGDADVSNPNYSDRQHTSSDILGVDTDSDGILDSLFVDFNYLARNTVINGNAAGIAAISPKTPDFTLNTTGGTLNIQITQQQQYLNYRVGIRSSTNDWDSVYSFSGVLTHSITLPSSGFYRVSVASVNADGIESLFSKELTTSVTDVDDIRSANKDMVLLQNKPNPFDEATTITVEVTKPVSYRDAYISIKESATGRELKRLPITLRTGVNEVNYQHGYHAVGHLVYTLIVDGKAYASKMMVFAN